MEPIHLKSLRKMNHMTQEELAALLNVSQQTFEGMFEPAYIKKWLREFYRRFFMQQYKRSCIPDGPKVGTVTLSPRGDWRMPSDADAALWLQELDNCTL